MISTLVTALLFVLPMAPAAVAAAPPAPAAVAATPPRVVVLQASGQRDQTGFVEALRIQLVSSGEVVAGAPLEGPTLPDRVAGAVAAAKASGALLAVWLERAPAPGGGEDVVLYVVGEADGRAVVQVFRLAEGSPADTDRALALKVGSVVDELLAPAALVVLAPVSHPAPPRVPTPPPAPAGPELLLGLDARLGSSPGDDGWDALGGVLAGVGLDELELHLTVAAGSGDSWSRAAGRVRTSELTMALGGRRGGLGGALALGVRVDAGARIVFAEGTSPGGRTGNDAIVEAVVSAALERRWRRGSFDLMLGLGGEWAPAAPTFQVNFLPVAELGHVRGFVSLSVLWRGR